MTGQHRLSHVQAREKALGTSLSTTELSNVFYPYNETFYFCLGPQTRKKTWPISSLIIWLAPRAGKMNQITRCDLLPERARWSHLACSWLPAVFSMKNVPESHIINPLLTKFVRSRWILASFFFCELIDLDFVSVHKQAKKYLANIQPSWPHTWSITHTSWLCFCWDFTTKWIFYWHLQWEKGPSNCPIAVKFWFGGLGEFLEVMQTVNCVSDLQNCLEFSKSPSCLDKGYVNTCTYIASKCWYFSRFLVIFSVVG